MGWGAEGSLVYAQRALMFDAVRAWEVRVQRREALRERCVGVRTHVCDVGQPLAESTRADPYLRRNDFGEIGQPLYDSATDYGVPREHPIRERSNQAQ